MTGPTTTALGNATPQSQTGRDPISNTLLITQVPLEAFEDPHPEELARELSVYGPLLTLIPLPSMSRFLGMSLVCPCVVNVSYTKGIAVYGATQAAVQAKQELNGRSLLGSTIRIYYGMVSLFAQYSNLFTRLTNGRVHLLMIPWLIAHGHRSPSLSNGSGRPTPPRPRNREKLFTLSARVSTPGLDPRERVGPVYRLSFGRPGLPDKRAPVGWIHSRWRRLP
jgi:hypothetical protein